MAAAEDIHATANALRVLSETVPRIMTPIAEQNAAVLEGIAELKASIRELKSVVDHARFRRINLETSVMNRFRDGDRNVEIRLEPLINVFDGNPIEGFPANVVELDALDGDTLRHIASCLGHNFPPEMAQFQQRAWLKRMWMML